MSLSIDVIKKSLPDKYKNSLNQELLDTINNTFNDPDLYETYRDNFLSYTSILNDGRFKITDYLNAVKYCTQKLMGKTNTDAYIITFPDRYQSMLNRGLSSKEMSSIISVYNKSKLVNGIMEQSLIPTWVINQDLYQKAINVQADLMMTAVSEKVRSDAANSLLIHLKPPETKKVELDIGLKQGSEVDQLRDVLVQLASQQRQMIETGVTTATETAEYKLIGQVIDHDEVVK
ncbi:hypothetical protein ACF3N0_00125 [Moraxella atlantae]|uniref:hypothetical protein n=1 Tax=Faucicola atlantae TaxID=34059 RepID=UPI0037520E06